MKLAILQLALILSLSAGAFDISFKTELEADKLFVEKNRAKIVEKYGDLLKYFQVKLSKPLQVEILPYQRNKDFKNCARIYGPYRIYSHSIKSLQDMPAKERVNYNEFCFSKTYEDLYYTLTHEFVHSLTMINSNTGKVPSWIWEGIAVAFSGQLENTRMGSNSLSSLQEYEKINLCDSNIKPNDVYSIGGPVISYLESKYPGFSLKLVQHLRGDPSFLAAKKFFDEFNIDCSLSNKVVINHQQSILRLKLKE